jgi:nucleoid-associated protein YgaU
MDDPLKLLLEGASQPNPFPASSRYAGLEIATHTQAETAIVYMARRILPQGDELPVVQEHVVTEGERLDHLAARYLGDPEQYWRICDGNNAMQPEALVSEPGQRVRITLPEGITG